MEQITLIDQLKNIRQRIELRPNKTHYICVHAMDEPHERAIKVMVREEIGSCQTVQEFLAVSQLRHPDSIANEEANAYRIQMLNRMIEEVSNEAK